MITEINQWATESYCHLIFTVDISTYVIFHNYIVYTVRVLLKLHQLIAVISYPHLAQKVVTKFNLNFHLSFLIGFIQGAEKSTNMTQIYKTLLLAKIKTGIKAENEEEKSVILRGLEDVQLTEINVLVIAAAVLCLCKEMGSEIMPL